MGGRQRDDLSKNNDYGMLLGSEDDGSYNIDAPEESPVSTFIRRNAIPLILGNVDHVLCMNLCYNVFKMPLSAIKITPTVFDSRRYGLCLSIVTDLALLNQL